MRARPAFAAGWIVLLSLLAACARDLTIPEEPPPPEGGAVTGRMVVEDATGATLPASTGRIELLRRSDRVQATAEGLFVLVPPQESWQALFRAGCDDTTNVCEKQKLVNSADLPLVPGVDLSLGDVVLSSNGDARGRVVLSDQPAGLVGGGVAVYVPGSPFRTETAADGSFKLPFLPEGTMTVAAFLAGYDPVAIPSVRIAAGTTTTLADIVLEPTVGTPKEGSISGTARKADDSGGTVTLAVLRGADLSEVDTQTKEAGESFVFAGLPYGFYTLTAEASGFGKRVVNSILLTDAPVGQPDVDVGEITIEEGLNEQPAGEGTDTTVSCALPASERGPCIASTTPPRGGVLPSMARVEIVTDEALQAGSEGAGFTSDTGESVAAEVVVAATQAGGKTSFTVRPRRPLTAGFWTLSLSREARDADGKAPAASAEPARWLVSGFRVGPAFVGDPIPALDLRGPMLPAIVNVDGVPNVTYRERQGVNQNTAVARVNRAGGLAVALPAGQNSTLSFPRPGAALVDGVLAMFVLRDCTVQGDAPFEMAIHEVPGDTINPTPVITPDCGDLGALAPSEPLLAAVGRAIDGSIVVVQPDAGGRAAQTKNTVGFVPTALEVAHAGASDLVASIDALGRPHVHQAVNGTLTEIPGVDALRQGDTVDSIAICSAGGDPLLLFTAGGRLGAFLRQGTAWNALPSPARTDEAREVACRTIGETPFVVARETANDRLLASYYSLESDTWELLASDEADGALNAFDGFCSVDPGVALGENADGGLLVAWSRDCDGVHALDMARVR